MASSSVSQEDFDQDYEVTSARRSRIQKSARARGTNRSVGQGTAAEYEATAADGFAAATTSSSVVGVHGAPGPCTFPGGQEGTFAVDHDTSPKPAPRAKDKRTRPNHINKGKQQRDRRKLREKRRSTGVVHLPSTESTGGSTGEEEEELLAMTAETKRNTLYNEIIEKDNNANPQEEKMHKMFISRRNKSLSDLDADDEDNQDYDSTVNQSDSTMSLKQECGSIGGMGGGDRNWSRTTNGRPDTPNTENLEELLERAREENKNLLELLADKDRKISYLEKEVGRLSRDLQSVDIENDKLKEENQALLRAMSQLQVA